MLLNESTKNATELLSNVDSIYISEKFFEMVNEQSCDCDEIVIKNGDKYILLTSHTSGEDGYIEIDTVANYTQSQFPYEVDISKENFKFDKFCFLENGLIDGIRFCADGVFLFIFALEHNLVLTKSKYDLFEEIEMILPETEAVLKIRKIEQQI
jgi:hypothetical protein